MTGWRLRRFAPSGVGRLVVVAVAGSVALAACASGTNSSSQPTAGAPTSVEKGVIGNQNDQGTPIKGGTLSFAGYSGALSLDPTKTQPSGSTGGTELAALYDVLVRYDGATNQFTPQLAQSLEADSDQKVWTLKLRNGVTFSDGTPLDAEAVVASINRFNTNRGANAQVWTTSVAKTEATDPATVVFTLNQPWREFPTMLASGHGMIVAASATKTATFTPVGAGPFVVERFAPHEELLLKARPDYWGGAPNLDKLRFVEILSEQGRADALKSGGIQMSYNLNPQVAQQIQTAGYPGYLGPVALGRVMMVNNAPGHPGADVRVRQAMAYATNTDTYNQRAEGGKGMPGSEIFPAFSPWHNDVAGLKYDPAKAKDLLEAAKQDGYNGEVSYMGLNDPASQQSALTMQAMLQAVGFTVKIDYQNNPADLVKKLYVDHNYDFTRGAFSLYDNDPYTRLYSAVQSGSTNNALGYKNPEMDAMLTKVQAASTDQEKKAALAGVQKLVNETVPFITLGAITPFVPWQKNVHGVKPTLDGVILFDKTWMNT